jgi:hypothetical protein
MVLEGEGWEGGYTEDKFTRIELIIDDRRRMMNERVKYEEMRS